MQTPPSPQFSPVNLAALAREIAMDILDHDDILTLHDLSNEEWVKIQATERFQAMVNDMRREWMAAANVNERVRIKAATAVEMQLEPIILSIGDEMIPLAQRIDAMKFLARLGELDGQRGMGEGERFAITLNIGAIHKTLDVQAPAMKTIEHE